MTGVAFVFRRKLYAEGCPKGRGSALLLFQRDELVDFSKIHPIGKLKSGNLPGMELHFKIRLQNGNVDGFTLSGVRALGADAIELHIPVMRFYEFIYDRIHDV
jgi:hypothetical protein